VHTYAIYCIGQGRSEQVFLAGYAAKGGSGWPGSAVVYGPDYGPRYAAGRLLAGCVDPGAEAPSPSPSRDPRLVATCAVRSEANVALLQKFADDLSEQHRGSRPTFDGTPQGLPGRHGQQQLRKRSRSRACVLRQPWRRGRHDAGSQDSSPSRRPSNRSDHASCSLSSLFIAAVITCPRRWSTAGQSAPSPGFETTPRAN
jgi:hypothetical protein